MHQGGWSALCRCEREGNVCSINDGASSGGRPRPAAYTESPEHATLPFRVCCIDITQQSAAGVVLSVKHSGVSVVTQTSAEITIEHCAGHCRPIFISAAGEVTALPGEICR
jgi:hypothetical protein